MQAARRSWRARLAELVAHVRTPVYRNAYALVANAALSSGLGMVYWVVVARLYPAETVGRNAAVISALVFLAGISQLNLRPVMSRFIPVSGRATARLVLASYLVAGAVSVGVATVFLAGTGLWAREEVFGTIHRDPVLGAAFVTLVVLWCTFSLQDGAMIGLRQSVWVPVENTAFGVAKIALAAGLALVPALAVAGVVLSWAVPMLAAALVVNTLVFRRWIPEHVRTATASEPLRPGRIARFVAGDYLGSLFGLAGVSLLPLIVITQTGATVAAHFYISWVIASSVQLVSLQMVTSLVVESAGDARAFRSGARHMAVQMLRLLVPATVGLVVLADPVLRVFGPGYAQDGADLLRVLALGLLPGAVINLYIGHARIRARVRGLVLAQAYLAVVTLGLATALLPRLGLVGVGLAVCAAQASLAAILGATVLRGVLVPSRR